MNKREDMLTGVREIRTLVTILSLSLAIWFAPEFPYSIKSVFMNKPQEMTVDLCLRDFKVARANVAKILGLACVPMDYSIEDYREKQYFADDFGLYIETTPLSKPNQLDLFPFSSHNSGLQPTERETSYLFAFVCYPGSERKTLVILRKDKFLEESERERFDFYRFNQ